jgi:hypothetical protein
MRTETVTTYLLSVFNNLTLAAAKAVLSVGRMKKRELAEQVAKSQGIAPAAAADRMDQAVNQIVRALRKGQSARLPGLGTITPGKRWVLRRESGER